MPIASIIIALKDVDEDDFQTPSLLPIGSPPFGSIIIIDDCTDISDMLFSH
jgi:hypothetical protein